MNKTSGFIKMIIVIIIAIAILSYYGINLKQIWDFILYIWNTFLAQPAMFLWAQWVEHIWIPFINSANSLKK